LCIKLVIRTSLYYDARSEKHQKRYVGVTGKRMTIRRQTRGDNVKNYALIKKFIHEERDKTMYVVLTRQAL
jgi:hypothetical protein